MQTQSEPQDDNDERRRYPHLRALYPDARELIDHFFHHRHEWAGSSINYLAQRVIHEAYPHLHTEEVLVLVAAIERIHRMMATEAALIDEIVTHYTLHAVH